METLAPTSATESPGAARAGCSVRRAGLVRVRRALSVPGGHPDEQVAVAAIAGRGAP